MRVSISLVLATAALLCASPLKTSKKKAASIAAPVDSTAKLKAVGEPDSLFAVLKVGREQSASWLAFRHLGAWTPEISEQIKRDNASIKDLNRLEVGQQLRLRRSLDQRGWTPDQQVSKAIRKAVITYARGSAHIVRQNGTTPVSINEFLAPGDKIVTDANAVVELVIDNQSVLRLRDKTVLQLVAIQDKQTNQKSGTSVYLEAGRVWSKVRKWAGPLVGFQVKMPNAIAGVHGTTFECFVQNDLSGNVSVSEGIVGVTGRAQSAETSVPAGKSVEVLKDGQLSQPAAASSATPEWKRFNEQRDQSLEEMTSAYLDEAQSSRNNPTTNESNVKVDQPDQPTR